MQQASHRRIAAHGDETARNATREREGVIPSQGGVGCLRTASYCFTSRATTCYSMSRNSMGVWGNNSPTVPRREKRLYFEKKGCIIDTITIRRITKCHW